METIFLKIRAHPLPKNEKRPLPVAVRRSKTPLLKLPNDNLVTLLSLNRSMCRGIVREKGRECWAV